MDIAAARKANPPVIQANMLQIYYIRRKDTFLLDFGNTQHKTKIHDDSESVVSEGGSGGGGGTEKQTETSKSVTLGQTYSDFIVEKTII